MDVITNLSWDEIQTVLIKKKANEALVFKKNSLDFEH